MQFDFLAVEKYSTKDLDRIISDMFEQKRGGSAAHNILPEADVIGVASIRACLILSSRFASCARWQKKYCRTKTM